MIWWNNIQPSGSGLSMEPHINHVSSIIHHRIHNFKSLAKYSNEKVRKQFANAYLISILKYGMPLYSGETVAVKNKVHKLWMTIARFCKNNYCFKQSTLSILNSLELPSSDQMIEQCVANYIHKIIQTNKPTKAKRLFRNPRSRNCSKIYPVYYSKTKVMDKNIYIRGLKVYNSLPDEIRLLPTKKFKKKIKSHFIDVNR